MFSAPSLHPPVLADDAERDDAAAKIRLIAAQWPLLLDAILTDDRISIPLITVSRTGSFDAYIGVRIRGAPPTSDPIQLLVDSGNTSMVLPYWEHIEQLPDWQQTYSVLGSGLDPWGNPAKIVRGPIDIPAADGTILSIDGCTFYAGTANSADPTFPRTANFGTGCITSWLNDGGATLQPPLSLLADHTVAAFHYAAADAVFSTSGSLKVTGGSMLTLFKASPEGVRWFDIVPDCIWMALVPSGLEVGGVRTNWPGIESNLIAMIDTGGTCAYLSDPEQVLNDVAQASPPANPD